MSPDDDLDADLRELARSKPRSGRAAQEVPPMPEGWCPHEPGDAFYELDWVLLREHPQIL